MVNEMRLKDVTISANTGLDAIKRAPIVEYNTGLKCIRIQDISQGKDYDDWGDTEISEKDYEQFRLKRNDLLVARTGATVGVSYLVKKDYNAVFNNGSIRLRLNKNVNIKFTYYVFQTKSFRQYIDNVSCVATQPNLRIVNLLRFNLPDCDLNLQNKIVCALECYDKALENNNKRMKALEQMAENLYKEWFVRFRFPGHENAEFENGIPKGWILSTANSYYAKKPRSWHFGNVSEFGEFKRGKNITSTEMIEGDIPVISAGLEPSGYHCDFNVKGKNITVSASGANAGYIKYNLDNIWAADCSYYQDEKYLWYVYNTLKFLQPVLKNMQCGAAQPHVYPKHINHLNVIIPADDIILKYCQIVNPLYDEIKIIHDININLIKQRDLLLPRLMSGKLEV